MMQWDGDPQSPLHLETDNWTLERGLFCSLHPLGRIRQAEQDRRDQPVRRAIPRQKRRGSMGRGSGRFPAERLSSCHIFSAKNIEATIIQDLLDGYNPQAFPLDEDKSVVVNVSYFLVQLQGLVSYYCSVC